jgi:hypothetical protein
VLATGNTDPETVPDIVVTFHNSSGYFWR